VKKIIFKFLTGAASGVRCQGDKMTVIEIIDAFTFYGIDILLLAMLTAVCVQICKITFLKKLNRKLLTFLPFFLGTLFYAAYAALKNMSLVFLVREYISVLEHGISVGAAATLLYVLYEQFVREKKCALTPSAGVISTLIEGYVPADKTEAVAKLILNAVERDVTGDGAKKTAEILTENAQENVTENDVRMLAKLIIETLAHINAV